MRTERQVSAILCQQHSPQAPCGFPLFELAMRSAEVIICVGGALLALGKFHNNTSPKTQYRCTIFNAPVPEPNFKNWHHYSSSTNCFNGAQCGRLLLTPHKAWIIQISFTSLQGTFLQAGTSSHYIPVQNPLAHSDYTTTTT